MNPRVRGLAWGLGLCLLALSAAALLTGPAALSADQVLAVLMGKGSIEASLIVCEIRLPRLLLALLVGAGLGASGAALQALLRNPLADPGVTGISASAALGAVLVFYWGGDAVAGLGLPLGGLLGALLGTLILLTLARRGAGTVTLILAGVALGSLASAATSLVLNLVPNPYAAYEIVFWLMGSLTDRALNHVWLIAPLLIPGLLLLLHTGSRLDTLALGEEVAASLGTHLPRLRTSVIVGTALCVGPGVAVAGFIGFVGLLVPHALRPWTGHRPAILIPCSALGGAALTLGADLLCRSLPVMGELKLGVVTALLGAPFLLFLLWRERGLAA